MTANLLFAVGSMATWLAWALSIWALFLLGKLALGGADLDRRAILRGLVGTGVGAAVLFILASLMPMSLTREPQSILLPVFWPAMPFVAWMALVSLIVALFRWVQAAMAISAKDRIGKSLAGAIWLLVAMGGIWMFHRDPDNKIEVFRGSIQVSGQYAAGLILLIIAGISAMVLSARNATVRGVSKTTVSQIALITGSIVFGIPFAFLVITSFKEDRDMSSPNGIVWIPRVQDTTSYEDPARPFFVTSHNGQTVKGNILEHLSDGRVEVEVEAPLSLVGDTFETTESALKQIPRDEKMVSGILDGSSIRGMVLEDMEDGSQRVQVLDPPAMKGQQHVFPPGLTEPIRHIGLNVTNYSDALSYLPAEANSGLTYLKNTLLLVIFSVIGTILSSSIVAYAFSRMKFPGRDALFIVLLSTMMLPGAVTMLPQFLIFRYLGWIDTLYPLWVPAFFASALNVFLLRQFFKQIPMELEDAAKIDGASYLRTFWQVMLPQIKPALAVIAIWTFMGAWNNFMGPLIYINSPENMPLSYALQLFQGERSGEPGLLMAFATMTIIPVLLLFFFAQRYFIEGVTLSGLGGR